MSDRGDDVSDLFKSFGADKSKYQELTRTTGAQQAQARWPLFNRILSEENQSPPLLSAMEKNRWSREQAASSSGAGELRSHEESDMMARSLRQLSRRAPDIVTQKAKPVEPSATEYSAPHSVSRPVVSMPVKSSPISASVRNVPVEHMPLPEKIVQKEARVPGLFPKNEPSATPENRQQIASAETSDLLVGIFKRLANENEAPASAQKPSFLRNIDRR